jgi:hypothetical protein
MFSLQFLHEKKTTTLGKSFNLLFCCCVVVVVIVVVFKGKVTKFDIYKEM